MRILWPLALMLMLPLLAPGAASHGDGSQAQTHLSVAYFPLEPNQTRSTWIETGEGPWRAGMVFILYFCFRADVRDAEVALTFEDGTVVDAWTFTGDECHKASTRIPLDDGPYHLNVTNRASAASPLWFYFDQTCDCTLKHVTLPGGWVVFAYDLRQGREYRIAFPLVQGWSTQGTVARLTGESAHWPQDFSTVVEAAAEGPGWMNLTFEAAASGPHYVFVHERAGVTVDPNTGQPQPVTLTPLVEEVGAGSPAFTVAVAALALGLALTWSRRRGLP